MKTMDAATAWLVENDIDYENSRRSWRHINDDGEYDGPSQERPYGLASDLAQLVASDRGRYVESVEHRSCNQCDTLFVPLSAIHTYCSELCRERARSATRKSRAAYMRSYMRAYRASKRAA